MAVIRPSKVLTGLLLGGAALGAAVAGYAVFLRPRHLRWGATDDEVKDTLPGDEIAPAARVTCTHAITIHAPVDQVWPWIAQIGQDRAGFYSYAWLENMVGAEITNADHVVPEFQDREIGDTVWMAPKHRYGGQARMLVASLEKGAHMVLVMPDDFERLVRGERATGCWSFVLRAVDDTTTRLLVRGRGTADTFAKKAFDAAVFEPAHFIMERKMMTSIRSLAEKSFAKSRDLVIS
ncbi:MAG: hypothetical protein AB7O67_21820 [Vicinamibacterales bacterium]